MKFKTLFCALLTVLFTASCSSVKSSPRSQRSNSPLADAEPLSIANMNADDEIADEEAEEEEEGLEKIVDPLEENYEAYVADINASDRLTQEEVSSDMAARKTFPMVYNEFVEKWIQYFTGRGRATFERYLERSGRFIPLIKPVLRQEGLPEDLAYLAMIESGFNNRALSHAKAVGTWQFMKATGTRFGLQSTYWIDDRRDIELSTRAAAAYLRELYQIFGSWYLAAASYNAGEGKVYRLIKTEKTLNFWEIAHRNAPKEEVVTRRGRRRRGRDTGNLRAETRNYVPKIIAAAIIAKNPEKYGFTNIAFQAPWKWEKVDVPRGVNLKQVAEITGSDFEDIKDLNPQLRRAITPPGEGLYAVRVPAGTKDKLVAALPQLQVQKLKDYIEHTVKRGDNIGSIARRYGSSTQAVIDFNDIKNTRGLRLGQVVLVPLIDSEDGKRSRRTRVAVAKEAKKAEPEVVIPETAGRYRVRPGDTLWSISRLHGVSVDDLKELNNLTSARALKAGMVIQVSRPNMPGANRLPASRKRG